MPPSIETTPEELLGPLNEVEKRNAPARLFVAGDVSLLRRGPRVSVVGSRKVSDEGARRARVLVESLLKHGMVVVSGLAEGVDTIAHETALKEKGATIAVIGTPLNVFYPTQNRPLQETLRQKHLVVSEFAPGTTVQPRNFPNRNRTMALLSDATIVVEAGEKSGTLHQCREALRLGRLLFLMENVAKNSALTWPSEMIRHGAQILSRENLDLVMEEMPEIPRGEPAPF